jgi:hypothetical protein
MCLRESSLSLSVSRRLSTSTFSSLSLSSSWLCSRFRDFFSFLLFLLFFFCFFFFLRLFFSASESLLDEEDDDESEELKNSIFKNIFLLKNQSFLST